MSRCQKCNSELPDGARFCGKCGFAQLPAESLSVGGTLVAEATVVDAVKTEDVIKTVLDTPPISPAVSLIPTRTVHPGLKQAALPGGTGSASLRPPDSEQPQIKVGEAEFSIKLGQREPGRDMIPETPKPSVHTSQFGLSNIPETPEPVERPETKGQLIRPITPLPFQSDTAQIQGQQVDESPLIPAQFSDPSTSSASNAANPAIPPVPVTKSVQFKSRVWPGNAEANPQPALTEQSQAGPSGMPNPISQPGSQPPLAGNAPGLIRQVGFSPSSLRPPMPSTPTQPGQSSSLQSGPAPMYPGSMPAPPPMVPPSAPTGSSFQQHVAPAFTSVEAPAQNRQYPFAQGQQQVESWSNQSPWQRPIVENPSTRQSAGVLEHPRSDPLDVFGLAEPEMGRLDVTGKAAQHWRQSWRDRQRAEAGPAEGVSRGHASVPMPLMAMQQSLVRMRAIILANKEQNDHPRNLGFWITLLLLFCLIGGLGAYIISSYISGSPLGSTQVVPPAGAAPPSLVAQTSTIVIGQSLHAHGEHFGSNDPISFLLDTTQPIVDASGRNISVQTNNQGAFDATILIGSDWTTGNHVIQANDNHSNQFAYLTINVLPAGTPSKSSSSLALLLNGQPLQQLSFSAVVGQDNPSQRFTLSNTSGTPLKWFATAVVDNNLNWLVIDDNHTFGTLNISGTDSIGVSAIITGLKSSTQPYKGQIIFTINDKEQLTLPVQLMVNDAPSELVFSPDPIIAYYGPGGTCQTGQNGASLTLINLGEQVISWKLGIDGNTSSHLHFSSTSGQLAPVDQSTPQFSSTQVVTLTCSGVQVGGSYTITVYANGAQWREQIFIQS